MLARCLAALMLALVALPLRADPVDDLMEALQIDEMIVVMREEGLAYGAELGADMFPGTAGARWQSVLEDIYDTDKMKAVVEAGFTEVMEGTETAPLTAYFASETGTRVVSLELDARRAMIEDTVEQAARERYRDLEGGDSARLEQITEFVAANDLVDSNVAGALNASFNFYRGLVEGGGLEMSESEILADVWSQEQETRADTREWLYGFLLLAYEPLSDAVLDEYVALSGSEDGRRLNRALFAGFNAMYDEISYALGLAAAQEMQGQDL
ncbi:DUF2059 domain-containing protein [Pseudoponticoccus marisrubri]|uniref:Ribosomal protein L21 n=1 Tax=Pseudoponticoccus marisrubri TaxID=1685382 RepID=A0A0W7WLC0_9RHOB|nr:DUF2059 domain-containing protein [Pseudoponticoccus marisrubri]KUF11408.1 ribosomal protein L21 [Pseudoponticoccus marisrubri]